MKGYSPFLKAPGLESHNQTVLCHIQNTLSAYSTVPADWVKDGFLIPPIRTRESLLFKKKKTICQILPIVGGKINSHPLVRTRG